VLAPGVLPTDARLPAIDQAGLAAFAERLRAAMLAAGHAPPPVVQALGFWNSGAGLALLVVAFLASLALAGGALWVLFSGEGDGGRRSGEAVGLLAMLPVGLGWLLRAAWRRRQAVRRALG
jgi:heme/copper-type cytochrome/quinol oxidase subunit 1